MDPYRCGVFIKRPPSGRRGVSVAIRSKRGRILRSVCKGMREEASGLKTGARRWLDDVRSSIQVSRKMAWREIPCQVAWQNGSGGMTSPPSYASSSFRIRLRRSRAIRRTVAKEERDWLDVPHGGSGAGRGQRGDKQRAICRHRNTGLNVGVAAVGVHRIGVSAMTMAMLRDLCGATKT